MDAFHEDPWVANKDEVQKQGKLESTGEKGRYNMLYAKLYNEGNQSNSSLKKK